MLHFMSVLGTGAYEECTYYWEKGEKVAALPKACDMPDKPEHCYTSRFIQIASLARIMEDNKEEKDIKVSIFMTDGSKAANWEFAKQRIDNDAVSKNGGSGTCEVFPGLGLELLDFVSGYPDTEFEIEEVKIAEGADQAGQEDIFNKIFESIDTGDTVYFDLTHGLRNLPIMAITILNYARTVKNITVGGLYYGAFEVGDKKRELAPIFDMTYCDDILQWSSAAESFVVSGSANQIKELYDRTNEANEKNNNGDLSKVKKTVKHLKNLTSCLETSRGIMHSVNLDSSKSISKAYSAYKASYKDMIENTEGTNQIPLKNLFGVIDDDLKIFDRKIIRNKRGQMPEKVLEETSLGVAAVRWAVNKGLVQQGLTALEATVTTYVCEMCEVDPEVDEYREAVYPALFDMLSRNALAQAYVDELREKLGHWVKGDAEKESLKKCMMEVKGVRNSINHFGILKNSRIYPYYELEKILNERFEDFLDIIGDDCRFC